MAKKKAKSDINTSEEIRNLLREDPTLTGPGVLAALEKKFPGTKFNKNSCGVAFTAARKKLGIAPGKRRKKGAKRSVVKKRPAAASSVDIATLTAAAKFVSQIGDADTAISAIRQVGALQIN